MKVICVFLAVALAGASVAQYSHWKSDHALALLLLRETGLAERLPDVAKRVERERDPQWAKLAIARALLAEHFDQRWLQNLEPQERQQEIAKMGKRLELARELAAEALSTRPATWQATMILGGASLFESARSGTPGVIADREAWEKPLRASLGLAPGEEEPRRLLAGAYLGIWPTLSQKRAPKGPGIDRGSFQRNPLLELVIRSVFKTSKGCHLEAEAGMSLPSDPPVRMARKSSGVRPSLEGEQAVHVLGFHRADGEVECAFSDSQTLCRSCWSSSRTCAFHSIVPVHRFCNFHRYGAPSVFPPEASRSARKTF